MRRNLIVLSAFICFLALNLEAARKPHVVSLGKTMQVKLFLGPDEDRTAPMDVRPLYVDGKLKEFTTGDVHEVTDRLFVVRRAFRLNNNLPPEDRKSIKWVGQRGGWLLVDRLTTRISQIALPEFDPFYSSTTWFRDYAAYCGISDNGDRLYAVVAQLGRRKAVLRKELGKASGGDLPNSECDAPTWERKPTRVTFLPKASQKITVEVFGHSADIAPGSTEED
jgi:hypothetical protein